MQHSSVCRIQGSREGIAKGVKLSKQALKTFFLLSSYLPDPAEIRSHHISKNVMKDVITYVSRARTPLIFWDNCKRFGLSELLTQDKCRYFQNFQTHVMFKNLEYKSAFYRLAAKLNSKRIPFACLKGLYLNIHVLKCSHLRSFNDVDILVDKQNFYDVFQVLSSMKFEADIHQARELYFSNELEYSNQTGIRFDVHHLAFPWFEEKYIYSELSENFMKRRQPGAPLRDQPMNYLTSEDNVLYALISMYRENLRSFRYVLDLDILLKVYKDQLDWNYLSNKIRQTRIQGYLTAYLHFLHTYFKSPIPNRIIKSIRPKINIFREIKRRLSTHNGMVDLSNRIRQRKVILNTGNVGIVLRIGSVYLKWQAFKKTGWLRSYFSEHCLDAKKLK